MEVEGEGPTSNYGVVGEIKRGENDRVLKPMHGGR
jgi:uncharacterized protein YgiM (DUF1202 family)